MTNLLNKDKENIHTFIETDLFISNKQCIKTCYSLSFLMVGMMLISFTADDLYN